MAELFQTTVPNVNQHLTAIYEEGELERKATIKRYLRVRSEGKTRLPAATHLTTILPSSTL